MRIVFRADASLNIGSGHVMRCLTLADALKARGDECHFVSRELPGHLLEVIRARGYPVHALPAGPADFFSGSASGDELPAHAAWLGCDWQADAQQSGESLRAARPDWLVVDHYALDQRWEAALRPHCDRLMVIDDLADRGHCCDLLLDQNLGREVQDYTDLVPGHCIILTGPRYALLRPDFAALREYSLQRRRKPALRQLLITMGGVDQPNASGRALETLKGCSLPADCKISVIMGLNAPWLQQVKAQAAEMPWPTDVLVHISDMAQRMADSDLAIGAAGGTAWERCCLGLPTLMVVMADNQWPGAKALQAASSVGLIGEVEDIPTQLPSAITALLQGENLGRMSRMASQVTDGQGVARAIQHLRARHD